MARILFAMGLSLLAIFMVGCSSSGDPRIEGTAPKLPVLKANAGGGADTSQPSPKPKPSVE